MIPDFVLAAFLSITMFSIGSIIVKYQIPATKSPYHFLILQLTMSFILFLGIYLVDSQIHDPELQSIQGNNLLLFLSASFFSFFGYMTFIIGLEEGKASVGAIFLSSRVFLSVPLAVIIIGEIYPPATYLLILIALIGAIVVSWEEQLSIYQIFTLQAKGTRYFVLTTLFWSLANFSIRLLDGAIPLITFLTARLLIFVILAFLIFFLRYRSFPKFVWTRFLISGMTAYVLLIGFGQLLFVYAVSLNLGVTETVGIFEGTLTFIFSVVFAKIVGNSVLKEPLQPKILALRTFGVLLAIVGTLGTVLVA